jgi:signal transduction histidine kinase
VSTGLTEAADERRRRLNEVIAEITQLLLGEFDQRDALELIARRAREISGARVGAVVLDGVVEALDGPDQEYVGKQLAGLDHVEQVALVDVPELGSAVVAPLPPGASAAGGVLLVTGGEDIGEVIGVLAGQVTLALDLAQARRDHSMVAVLEDRDRIARDLHDLVIQRLFATGLQLQGIGRMVTPEVQDRIGRAIEDIDTTIRDLRAAIFELHHHPGRRSLRSDIQGLVAEYADPLGFRPRLTCAGPLDAVVPVVVAAQVLAAIREALSNVVRHAGASAVSVEVTAIGSEVIARVVDDGVGVASSSRESGLRNLQERAQSLGGAVRLQRSQPHGTVLELRIPLA